MTGLLALSTGWGGGVERSLRDARDGLRTQATSGDIAIVEIDAKSLRQLSQWPWPRRYHAAVVDRLHSAGAELIAFDVNFAVRSNPQDDAALAAALERAGGSVGLPTYEENEDGAGSQSRGSIPV
jgi:CHASE2 domain-containing sensor protein